ncbi:nuclear transport factor 2 family protein [Actinomadura sp. HBU206391]|uniref:nuclear transport factor 2 family protein n=1 Tax=Actinomadura sp. HBU206391 TaxID=2731692 RepID=UPI001C9BE2F8|nr:nuclear transport factor 2 family protein [Actinomadura sp. HBU206391]
MVRRFAEAFSTDDIDALVALLTDDAWLAMPPAPHEYHGVTAIASFLRASATWRAGRRLRLRPTRANGQPAFGCHLADAVEQPTGIIVLTLTGDRIHGITRFLDARLLHHFEPSATSSYLQ